jgi:hypothetical protein
MRRLIVVLKILPLDPVRGHLSPVFILTHCFSEIQFNIIFPSTFSLLRDSSVICFNTIFRSSFFPVCLSQLPLCNNLNSISWRVQITNLFHCKFHQHSVNSYSSDPKILSSTLLPITVAARSKAGNVFALSNTGIAGSNPTRGMDVCPRFFCVCVVLCR